MASRPPFDVWAPQEILRLRSAADELERTLNLYNAATRAAAPASSMNGATVTSYHRSLGTVDRAPRRSRYEKVFASFASASGEHGLSLDEMERLATEAGMPIKRNILRSTVFAQKKAGRVAVKGDRYVWQTQGGDTEREHQDHGKP